jgi:nitroreductase
MSVDDTLESPIPKAMNAWHAFEQLTLSRRSIRRYSDRPVAREELSQVIELATRGPSNFNRQPWRFFVFDQPDPLASLRALYEARLNEVSARDANDELGHMIRHARRWKFPFDEARAIVLLFYKPAPERLERRVSELAGGTSRDVDRWHPDLVSTSMAAQSFLLAAAARGLGACAHSAPVPFLRRKVNQCLEVSEGLELALVLTVGHPNEQPEPTTRKPVDGVCSFVAAPLAWGIDG